MTKKKKILIVDDSSYHRYRVKKLLEDNGYRVFEATDGIEGVQMFRKTAPELVVMDINMPVMDGIEAIKYIRRVDHDAVVIMYSTLDEESMVMAAFKAGAKDYIVKPLDADAFMKTIAKHVRGS